MYTLVFVTVRPGGRSLHSIEQKDKGVPIGTPILCFGCLPQKRSGLTRLATFDHIGQERFERYPGGETTTSQVRHELAPGPARLATTVVVASVPVVAAVVAVAAVAEDQQENDDPPPVVAAEPVAHVAVVTTHKNTSGNFFVGIDCSHSMVFCGTENVRQKKECHSEGAKRVEESSHRINICSKISAKILRLRRTSAASLRMTTLF